MTNLRYAVILAAAVIVPSRPGSPASRAHDQTAVFAGGCYWGVESVFEHVRGVKSAESGFAFADTTVRSLDGAALRAGYAEAVRVVYDPAQVSYQRLLEVFFLVAHDPTQRDRQGPDVGPQYRSVVFISEAAQREAVREYLASLRSSGTYPAPIVTEVAPLRLFRPAGADQQDYAARHPTEPYIVINDTPKLEALRGRFPALYREEATGRN